MRNNLEKRVAAQLGPEFEYEAIKLTYQISHTYLPDFIDRTNKVIIETKGHFPAEDRRKMRAVKEQHPDWAIRMVFQNPDAKISKTSKTTYAAWCEKQGIEWAKAPAPLKPPDKLRDPRAGQRRDIS